MRTPGALRELLLIWAQGASSRPTDPLPSWEKPAATPEDTPEFEPGPAEGDFEDPVVDRDAAELTRAIPSLGRPRRKHRNAHERVIIRVEHVKDD